MRIPSGRGPALETRSDEAIPSPAKISDFGEVNAADQPSGGNDAISVAPTAREHHPEASQPSQGHQRTGDGSLVRSLMKETLTDYSQQASLDRLTSCHDRDTGMDSLNLPDQRIART